MRIIAVAVLGSLVASLSVLIQHRPASALTLGVTAAQVEEPVASFGQAAFATKPSQEAASPEAVGVIIEYEGASGVDIPNGPAEVLENVGRALADNLDPSIDDPVVESATELEGGLFAVELENLGSHRTLEEIVDVLGEAAGVVSVEPDWLISVNLEDVAVDGAHKGGITRTSSTWSDSVQSGAEWGLDRIDQRALPLDSVYSYRPSGDGVRVYVVDTGVRSSHSDFTGRVVSGFTSIRDGRGWEDCNGHGTHVAGTIAGELYGVAKGATIVPVRVLDCAGSGSDSTVIDGLNWVLADVLSNPSSDAVVNMSLGGPIHDGLDNKVVELVSAGVTVVVASGNEGQYSCNVSPARVAAAVTVNASTKDDRDASWSNYGSCSDLYAPGVSIRSAWYSGDLASASLSGTSMAAPHVAGVAAQTLEVHPGSSPSAVAGLILENASEIGFYGVSGDPDELLFGGFLAPVASAPRPEIVGSARVGQTLEVVDGVWDPGFTLAHQWLLNGVPITGSTGLTFALEPSMLGAMVSVVTSGVKVGSPRLSATSLAAMVDPGVFTPLAAINGSTVVGQTLLADPGNWGAEAVSFSYQWLSDGKPIKRATGLSYVVNRKDAGKLISVRVTGSAPSYRTATVTSAQTEPVRAYFLFDSRSVRGPVLRSSVAVGQMLSASHDEWVAFDGVATYRYQWLSNGKPIKRATGLTYVVQRQDLGKRISVRVTGSAPSHLSVTATSNQTEPVSQ
jgi:subtilisin family serine protease